jgi:hypothetical protein
MNARVILSLCTLVMAATAFAAEPNPAASPTSAPAEQGHSSERMQAMMKACNAKQGDEQKQCREEMRSEHMKSGSMKSEHMKSEHMKSGSMKSEDMKSMSGMHHDMNGMKGMQGDGHGDHMASPAAPATPSGHDHDHDPKN